MTVREIRKKLGITQGEMAERYGIPLRTIQNWENGTRKPPDYLLGLLQEKAEQDLINRKCYVLPGFDTHKRSLPKRNDYVGALKWLSDVRDCLGEDTVFALDEALMCNGSFGGRNDEYIVWVYGDDSLSGYNGVVVLGNYISPYCVKEKNGLRYTDFNRTLSDAFANENILDMQGITEAVAKYYFSNGESFEGISVPPVFQKRFEEIAHDAIGYYES